MCLAPSSPTLQCPIIKLNYNVYLNLMILMTTLQFWLIAYSLCFQFYYSLIYDIIYMYIEKDGLNDQEYIKILQDLIKC